MGVLRRAYNKVRRTLYQLKKKYDLSRYGERVDIDYDKINYDLLDLNERAHIIRYSFAQDFIKQNSNSRILTCGDFACGSGYGSAMLAECCNQVIGVDYDSETISKIGKRYKRRKNLDFISGNLLEVRYDKRFDFVVSFETVEHFEESTIVNLLSKFYSSLKKGGILILSTPYGEPKDSEPVLLGYHKAYDITPGKLTNWLKSSGFAVNEIKFQSFQDLTIREKQTNANFMIAIGTRQ